MIPVRLLEKFRVLSLDRVGRVEATWIRLLHVEAVADERQPLLRQIQRELHTLKGDAAIVGAHELQHLSHELEELLKLAERRRFQIAAELELVVTTAIRLLATLLRTDDVHDFDLQTLLQQIQITLRDPE